MADFVIESTAIKETLAQVQGEMNLFRGNMETIIEYLQTQRVAASANHAFANVTSATVLTTTADVFATIETPVETVVPTDVNKLMFTSSSRAQPTNYQLLYNRIRFIEGFSVFGVDARDLCEVLNMVLPQKFKVLDLPKYKGLSYPQSHITMYCRKMASYIDNDDLLIHCFQDSLSRPSLDWYMGLERTKIRS